MLLTWSASLLAADEKSSDSSTSTEQELAEVQVTGTRIAQRPGYTSPNPITSVTGDDLKKLGMINVGDALTTLVPQNISNTQPANTGFSSFYIGQTFANLRGLNNVDAFGTTVGSRTLTLIDGRRVVSSSNLVDAVDLNIIPSNLLERADVVTGGASATYGSGAMAGVVNLVLNNRLQGINLDMDYGVNEVGDGGKKHIALSGGTSLLDGRGHLIIGGEWEDDSAIYGCGGRGWCESSSTLLSNGNIFLQPGSTFQALTGFENYPSRFHATNVRYSQWSPNGVIATTSTTPNATTGLRFAPDGTGKLGIEEYTLGLGWANVGQGSAMNGDGPLATSFTTMAPASNRKTATSHFEFDFSDRTTGYLEGSFAKTGGVNRIRPSLGAYCVRFDNKGSPAHGGVLATGTVITVFSSTGAINANFSDPGFLAFIGLTTAQWNSGAFGPGWFATQVPLTNVTNVVWGGPFSGFYYLASITLTAPYNTPVVPAVLPTVGNNSYAFLSQLDPQALLAVQTASLQGSTASQGNSPNTGNGTESLWRGGAPCNGGTTIYKEWNDQYELDVDNNTRTLRGVVGAKGRWGDSWRWDTYYQYGETKSNSLQTNATTSYALAFALDAVIDTRANINGAPNPNYGMPVCRVTRDGVQASVDPDGDGLNAYGEPFQFGPLTQLAQGCQPLDVLGGSNTPAALNYAFRNQTSAGLNTLNTLSFTTSGTIWNAWAGPLTGAFTLEARRDAVDNGGTRGAGSELQDILFAWPDAFSGNTKVTEESAEFNLPLVSEVDGIKLLSIDTAVRVGQYRNKGGVGTTGQSGTQSTTNWKFSTQFQPFDWVTFRLTRSRDLRAAGYRELYLDQQGVQDASTATNYWRSSTNTSVQSDRVAQNFSGDPNLKPEKSDTFTTGLVLSPGGWAQGMKFSVDYSDIRVKDGLTQTFSPVQSCWTASGNKNPDFVTGPGGVQIAVPNTGVNGLFDPDNEFCKQVKFWDTPVPGYDGAGSTAPCHDYGGTTGYICLSNMKSFSTFYQNDQPFRIRGLDISWLYNFPLNRVFENLPGTFGLNLTGNRALEASGNGTSPFCPGKFDYVGQLSAGEGCNPAVQPTPKWSGNFQVSYLTGNLTTTLSARYIGAAKIDKVFFADGPGQTIVSGPGPPNPTPTDPYKNAAGQYLVGSIDDNSVPPYFNFSLNASYNLQVSGTKQFQVFGTINNLFDKDPPVTGGAIAGASTMFNDIYGRAYRAGIRVNF